MQGPHGSRLVSVLGGGGCLGHQTAVSKSTVDVPGVVWKQSRYVNFYYSKSWKCEIRVSAGLGSGKNLFRLQTADLSSYGYRVDNRERKQALL